MTWGTIVGGIATFLGGARAPLAIGILQQTTGDTISFGRWALAALPTVLILCAVGYVVLISFFSPEIKDIQKAVVALRQKHAMMGTITQREKSIGK